MKKTLILFVLSLCLGSQALADSARLLKNSREAFQARVDMIARAKTEITAEYFQVGKDYLALGGLALMREAARRGVKVRVLVDAMFNQIPKEVISILRDEPNFELKVYNPLNILDTLEIASRLHDKSICIDGGEICLAGSRNITEAYFLAGSGTRFNDLDVIFNGGAARDASAYFDRLWQNKDSVFPDLITYDPSVVNSICYEGEGTDCQQKEAAKLAIEKARKNFEKLVNQIKFGKSVLVPSANTDWLANSELQNPIRFLNDDPGKEKTSNGISMELHEIVEQNCKKSLLILTPYLVFTDRAYRLIKQLRESGVMVVIITNSPNSNDSMAAERMYLDNRQSILDLGVELWEYKGPDTLHAKAGIIDGQIALIGSWNFDILSNKKNREIGIEAVDPDIARNLTDIFDYYQSHSYQIGPHGEVLNNDGKYGKISAAKKIRLQVAKVIRPVINRLKKGN